VLARVASGKLKVVNAAEMLRVSYRQMKRIWRRYGEEGAEGLKHRSAGKESNRKKPKQLREKVLRLVGKKYSGQEGERFGPKLAAEHLANDDQVVAAVQTWRRWMLEEGLWRVARKQRAHRKRRERKKHFGELVQMDGSFHDWFEERGPRGCLMNLVDDATSQTLARLGAEETIWAAVGVLRAWMEKYGVPRALYTNWKNVYVREPSEKELLRGEVPVTQFGRMCERLGIRIIAASSPQAKGRVERNHGTHQDRLVKKMRLKKIATYEAANEFLEHQYLPEHNRRFATPPASGEDYHHPAPKRREWEDVFHLETERVIGNDWVVRYDNRYFQVQRHGRHYAPAKAKVVVCEWEDGRLEIRDRDRKIEWTAIDAPPAKPTTTGTVAAEKTSKYGSLRPKPDHPWRRNYPEVGQGKAARSVVFPTSTPALSRAVREAEPLQGEAEGMARDRATTPRLNATSQNATS